MQRKRFLHFVSTFLFLLVLLQGSSCQSQETLTYKVVEPSLPSSAHPPVLFLLHGFGSDEMDLLSLSKSLPQNLLVVSVRAPYDREGGGYMWYDLQFGGGKFIENLQQAQQSKEKLIELISKIKKKYDVDTSNIFLGGFSQGAITSLRVGLTPPHRFKGLVCLSGRFPDEINTQQVPLTIKQQTHIFVSHGTMDSVIPISDGRDIISKLSQNGFQISGKEYAMQHQITNEVLNDLNTWMKSELLRK
ncbi:MAG: esterase [Bacteroidetes bacterium]|nr:esterase [Bacteroidota bacterium]